MSCSDPPFALTDDPLNAIERKNPLIAGATWRIASALMVPSCRLKCSIAVALKSAQWCHAFAHCSSAIVAVLKDIKTSVSASSSIPSARVQRHLPSFKKARDRILVCSFGCACPDARSVSHCTRSSFARDWRRMKAWRF